MSTTQSRGEEAAHVMWQGTALWWSGCLLSVYIAQAYLEAPLEVPTISQWSQCYSGLDLAQTAGTKTLPRPHCGASTCSCRDTHTQPRGPPSHRLTQELTWTLGCRPADRSSGPVPQYPAASPQQRQHGIFPALTKVWNFQKTKPEPKRGNAKNMK